MKRRLPYASARLRETLGKRAQLKLSFGMIFSIILIIIFLAFAIYAINLFLDLGSDVSKGKFVNDLQSDVDRVWKSSQSSQEYSYNIPDNIEYACVIDFEADKKGPAGNFYDEIDNIVFSEGNFVLYAGSGSLETESFTLENIDVLSITTNENPYCIRNLDGKITLVLEKGFSDRQVNVKRSE